LTSNKLFRIKIMSENNNQPQSQGDQDIESPNFWKDVRDGVLSLADLFEDAGLTDVGKFFDQVGQGADAVGIALSLGQGDVTGVIQQASEIAGGTIGGTAAYAAINAQLAKTASRGISSSVLRNILSRRAIFAVGARLRTH
jgi:hypothetical protein